MATTTEQTIIAAMIGTAIVAVVSTRDIFPPVDPVVAHYARIDTLCAQRMPDGSRIEKAWLPNNSGYVICPQRR